MHISGASYQNMRAGISGLGRRGLIEMVEVDRAFKGVSTRGGRRPVVQGLLRDIKPTLIVPWSAAGSLQ